MRENREMENGNIPFVDIEKEASKEIDNNSTEKNEIHKKSPGRQKLESWLNYTLKIQMTDGRTLIGVFLCTDQDNNIILGSCNEYLSYKDGQTDEEPRVLGLAMVPGRHVVSICLDSMLMASQNSAYVT